MKHTITILVCGLTLAAGAWASNQTQPSAPTPTKQVDQLRQELRSLRQYAGLMPLQGPGVTIVLQDKADASKKKSDKSTKSKLSANIVHDFDLLLLINELKEAGAEAIAINGVRLGHSTWIGCDGPVIYVGHQAIGHPFKLEAIGDAAALEKALSDSGSVKTLRAADIVVRVSRTAKLHLPASDEITKMRFAKPD